MGGLEKGGKSAGDWRFANFFPSRLEEGQALLYEASALGQQPADFTKFFQIGRSAFRVSRHAARWAGLGNSVNCVEL